MIPDHFLHESNHQHIMRQIEINDNMISFDFLWWKPIAKFTLLAPKLWGIPATEVEKRCRYWSNMLLINAHRKQVILVPTLWDSSNIPNDIANAWNTASGCIDGYNYWFAMGLISSRK